MKRRNHQVLQLITAIFVSWLLFGASKGFAQQKSAAMKIGTYDSRIVTFAWSRSDFFGQRLAKIRQQSDSAEKAHDTVKLKEVSVGAISYQHLLHQMVFSSGSAAFIMALVNDKLPGLAKSAGVSIILSKWELTWSDPGVEIVDLTSQVAALFNPKDNIDKMAGEMTKQDPIPIDHLDIENDMIDGYCKRFGKK